MKLIIFFGTLCVSTLHVFANPVPQELKTVPNVTGTCQDGYTQPGNSDWLLCYKVYTDDAFQADAADQCKSDGGSLASVPNAFVNSYLYSLAADLNVYYFALGIRCKNKTECVNDDSTKFQYTNFASGQDIPPVNCVYMQTHGIAKQKWLQWPCSGGQPFACEIQAGVVQEYTCPSGFLHFEGMCYKFFELSYNISANDASAACQKFPGGNLASANTYESNAYLANHDPKSTFNKQNTAFGLRCPNILENGDIHSCKWDDGSLFINSEFRKGYPGMYYVGSGCCEFDGGKWSVCSPCEDSGYFNAYICQAPQQFV